MAARLDMFTILGLPAGLLVNLTYDRIIQFSREAEITPLQDLFISAFYKSLDSQRKFHREMVKKLKTSIKKNEAKFLEIFNVNVKSFNTFISKLKTGEFQETVAVEIVNRFRIEESLKDVMVLIVRDCLANYQEEFLKTMTEKQGIQLSLLLQEMNLDMIPKSSRLDEKISSKLDTLTKVKRPKEETKAKKKKEKQIKVLSITASPEGVGDIYYEMEQDTMLDAFKSFDREEVFLDIPDPVKSTLLEIEEHLNDGHHDILHIIASGGVNDYGEGFLSFEDQQGSLQKVTGAQLANALKACHVPMIVMLSAGCSTGKEPHLMPVAQALFSTGIDTVIGMKKALSHKAAVEFNAAFFRALCRKKTVKQAFKKGKEAVLAGEQRRIEELSGWDAVNEYEIPRLLAKDENLTMKLFSDHRIGVPGRLESHHFLGAKYLERGFIGRRQVLRNIFKIIENKEGAAVLKGPGGIGKSTLTTRTAANLRRKGYEFIVVRGETTIEQILEAIFKKAAALEVKEVEKIFEANAEPREKLSFYLERFLLKQKVVLILDNFEENQDEEKAGEFKKERLKEFLWFFRDSLKHHDTFLFFSTRYTLPGFDSPDIIMNIPEFSPVEFRKMLVNSKALKRLDGKSAKALMEQIGGNPRAMELLDKIAYEEFNRREFTWEELKNLIPKLRERIIEKKGREDDFSSLFLDTLLGYLNELQRQLLDVLSIYRNPVPEEAITTREVVMEEYEQRKLEDLSLLECINLEDSELYYIHRLTAKYLLEHMKPHVKNRYHIKAAQYFESIQDDEGKKYIENDIEARWHYIQANQWNKAAELTFALEDYLTLHGSPQRSMELLQELDVKKLSDTNKYSIYLRMGNLYKDFGEYDEALTCFQKSWEISEIIGDIKGVSDSLHQIGMIYHYRGDHDAALTNYQKCKEINEKIDDVKGLSYNLHQIGMIYQDKGDYDAALSYFQKSMEIKEKIGDVKGVSDSLHQIGMIYQDKGDYDAALSHFQKSMDINEKIGDIAGSALSMGQMGTLYFFQNKFETALKFFIQAFMVFNKIGSPYAYQAKKDIARVRENLTEDQFNVILKEFNLSTEVFDTMKAEDQQRKFMEFLSAVTLDAGYAVKKSIEDKEKFASQLNEIMDKIPDAPIAEGFKAYLQLLVAYVKGEQYQAYFKKIPGELKKLFKKPKKEQEGKISP